MYLFITGAGVCTAGTKLINKQVLLSGVYINQLSLTSDCAQQSPPSCLCLKIKSLLMAMLYENKCISVLISLRRRVFFSTDSTHQALPKLYLFNDHSDISL